MTFCDIANQINDVNKVTVRRAVNRADLRVEMMSALDVCRKESISELQIGGNSND